MESYFYSDEKKEFLKEKLITEKAKKWAEDFKYKEQKKGRDKKFSRELSSSQIRKYYNEVKAIEKKLEISTSFSKIIPEIKMLKAKVAYDVGRDGSKMPLCFKEFVEKMIDNINDKEDFQAFLKVFETVIGYFVYVENERKIKKKYREDL